MSGITSPDARPRGRRVRGVAIKGVVLVGALGLAWWFAIERPTRARDQAARAVLARGRAYLQGGRPIEALGAVARLPEDGPRGAEVMAVRGLALSLLNRPEEACGPLERSFRLDPKQPMVAKVLAAIYFSRNQDDRGLAMLEAAARLDPGDFRPHFAAGDLNRRHGRAEAASRAFAEALRRRPDHHESRVGLIWARLATRDPESVGPLLEQALHQRPDDPEVHVLAARQALDLGDSEAARRHVENGLARDPNSVEALLIRARLNREAGRLDRALDDAERAARLAPFDPNALNALALIEAAAGLKARSAATADRHRALLGCLDRMRKYTKQIDARPDDPEPRWRLGRVAAEGGLIDLAAQNYRAALALDPRCGPAREGLAALATLGQAPRTSAGPPGPRTP